MFVQMETTIVLGLGLMMMLGVALTMFLLVVV
uniref:Uncharacterized protein n=1 Tax=Moniliophthora roreri TaxID=221103 RepID=A0A0W0FC61_MONRR